MGAGTGRVRWIVQTGQGSAGPIHMFTGEAPHYRLDPGAPRPFGKAQGVGRHALTQSRWIASRMGDCGLDALGAEDYM